MKIPFEVLYEDKDTLIINKPPGIIVHGDGKSPEKTISDMILDVYPEMKDVGEPMTITVGKDEVKILRPGIVHRLDRETSGCLLIARNQNAYEFYKNLFKNHQVQKTYHAFVYGGIKNDSGTIDAPINRSRGDIRKWVAGVLGRGVTRDAITKYEVISRIGVDGKKGSTEDGTYTYVSVMPKTGRTHQIRVHLKYLNHPIVCDSLYAPNRKPGLGFERLALHAYKLQFTTTKNVSITIEAPLPEDFIRAIKLIPEQSS